MNLKDLKTSGYFDLNLAKALGQPINPHKPTPFEVDAIADVLTAKVGEKIYRFTALESENDICLDVETDGSLTVVKRSVTGDAELTFKGLNSKLEYVLVDDILSSTDENKRDLATRKASITRSMDKREVRMIVSAILNKTAGYLPGANPHEYTIVSGDDLYDAIMGMKHLVEDFGDDFVLLVGNTVKEKIDTYDKDNVGSFNYNIGLKQRLADMGIKDIIKVFGKVEAVDASGEVQIMDKKKMILVARNSRIADGKPIKFVRRKISAEVAKLIGAEADSMFRIILKNPAPVNNAGSNTFGYGVYGYESIIFTITNPKAVAICDATSIV